MIVFLLLVIPATSSMTATVNVPERFSEVSAGERIYFETEIKWPENNQRQDLILEYSVLDSRDEEIAYLKVLKAIETQASFMDFISLPESIDPGLHKIVLTIADYEEFNQEVAVGFTVRKSGFALSTYMNIILTVLALIAIVVSIELYLILHDND